MAITMKFRFFALLLLPLAIVVSCLPTNRTSRFADLDQVLDDLATEHGVPGYSFALFDDREILYQRVAGHKNEETEEAVDAATVFEAASISKPVFAYIVLAMARAGVLDLDAPIGAADPVAAELGHDERSAGLTPRMLLAHLGGLPNWRSRINFTATNYEELFAPDDQLQFIVDPGAEYRYSGEGYVLLQQVVEQAAQRGLNELAQEMVFDPLGMTRSSYLFDEDMQANASSYPVLDDIYPGPQAARVPKSFSAGLLSAQSMAELGFVVVMVDGRGTPLRSKSFDDYSYGNLQSAGAIQDHIAALGQLLPKHPYLDLDRVGIYGHSGGGFASAHAILTYPEFYKVAVSSAGNHDQRSYTALWGEKYHGLTSDTLIFTA